MDTANTDTSRFPGGRRLGRGAAFGLLVFARVVQGIATGMATGALAAGLVEFSPEGRPHMGPTMTAVGTSFGLAAGGGLAGLLVQVSPRPDAELFPALTLAFVVLAALVLRSPRRSSDAPEHWPRCARESGFPAKRGGRSSPRCPPSSRRGLSPDCSSHSHRRWCATCCTPGSAPPAVSASRVLFIANSAGALWAGRRSAPSATLLGAVLLSLGAAGLAAALVFASPAVFIGGSIVSGMGVGLTFNGALRGISAATTAKSRSEVFSAAFVVSYAALGIPAFATGLAAPSWGLKTTSYLYISFIAVLSLSAAMHAAKTTLTTRPPARTPLRVRETA